MHYYKYSQYELCQEVLEEKNDFFLLQELIVTYEGLCEVICNAAIKKNLLGSYGPFSQIEASELNKADTHILRQMGFFQKASAFLFNHYPFQIYSLAKNKLSGKIEDHFNAKFENLEVGCYVKFFVFHKTTFGYGPRSHSLLIKKTDYGLYSFFDPNHGEFSDLTINELSAAINYASSEWNATHMAFINGDRYIDSLSKKPGFLARFINASKSFFRKLMSLFCCGGQEPPSPPPPPLAKIVINVPTKIDRYRDVIRNAESDKVIYPVYRREPAVINENEWGNHEDDKAFFDKPRNAHKMNRGHQQEARRQMVYN